MRFINEIKDIDGCLKLNCILRMFLNIDMKDKQHKRGSKVDASAITSI